MKKFLISSLISMATVLPSFAFDDTVFQYSTEESLKNSIFDGTLKLKDLKKHGDFGIGVFNKLDGELILLDGQFYRIKDDGLAYLPDKSATVPFAIVKNFKSQRVFPIEQVSNLDELKKIIDKETGSSNIFYAIKVTAVFDYVKTRSSEAQTKPYPNPDDISYPQFEYENVRGTLIGFKVPPYARGIAGEGYHFHFITKTRKSGGHLVDAKIRYGKVQYDKSRDFNFEVPQDIDFYNADLGKEKKVTPKPKKPPKSIVNRQIEFYTPSEMTAEEVREFEEKNSVINVNYPVKKEEVTPVTPVVPEVVTPSAGNKIEKTVEPLPLKDEVKEIVNKKQAVQTKVVESVKEVQYIEVKPAKYELRNEPPANFKPIEDEKIKEIHANFEKKQKVEKKVSPVVEKPKTKSVVKNEVKNEVKPAIKQEVKTEIKNEVKPELKSEVKSEKAPSYDYVEEILDYNTGKTEIEIINEPESGTITPYYNKILGPKLNTQQVK